MAVRAAANPDAGQNPAARGARRNALLSVAAVGVAALLAGAALAGCQPGASGSSGTGGLPSSTASTASPDASSSDTMGIGSPSEIVDPKGWPITIRSEAQGGMVVGPDGTVYAPGMVPADKTGRGRSGWLALPDGSYLVPSAFGPDGSAFGEIDGKLWAFGPDGKARSGWPVDVAASSWAVSPAGSVYLMQWPTEGSTSVTILDDHAAAVSTWSVPKVLDYSCDYLIQQDGTFWLTYPVTDPGWWAACEIHAFNTKGHELSSGAPGQRWTGMSKGPNGVVVAWYYAFSDASQDRPDKTRVALVGLDGKPAKGWPITLDGAASAPAFGPDGTIYFTLLASSESRVLAFDATGRTKPGWPVRVTGDPLTVAAAGTEPLLPQPPIVGDGAVYVATQKEIDGYDATAKVLAGWPYVLPAAWDDSLCSGSDGSPIWNMGPVYSATESGSNQLYLGLKDRIVALAPDGAVAAGWPYSAGPDFVCWREFAPAPGGGLIATASYQTAGGSEYRIVRLTPEAKFPE